MPEKVIPTIEIPDFYYMRIGHILGGDMSDYPGWANQTPFTTSPLTEINEDEHGDLIATTKSGSHYRVRALGEQEFRRRKTESPDGDY